jgi:hypothetical protein
MYTTDLTPLGNAYIDVLPRLKRDIPMVTDEGSRVNWEAESRRNADSEELAYAAQTLERIGAHLMRLGNLKAIGIWARDLYQVAGAAGALDLPIAYFAHEYGCPNGRGRLEEGRCECHVDTPGRTRRLVCSGVRFKINAGRVTDSTAN